MTYEANFEKNYLFLIMHLILGKVTKFLVEKLSTSEVISQKPRGGWKTPRPSAFRVKEARLQIVMDYTILQNKRMGAGRLPTSPPPTIFEWKKEPRPTVYHIKGNLVEIPN